MMFSVNNMFILPDAGSLKAFVDVNYYDLVIKGVRVLKGAKGMFVSMPQEQGKDNRWYDQVICARSEAYEQLCECVLSHYEREAGHKVVQQPVPVHDGWTNLIV